eukprot:GHVU01119824.1.p1 GENE.GHVU01119824.1~~GHVU01119824.1.p1  ORF type:complete len:505 (+),score=19.81 GHVU01119824.1:122-1516(+)
MGNLYSTDLQNDVVSCSRLVSTTGDPQLQLDSISPSQLHHCPRPAPATSSIPQQQGNIGDNLVTNRETIVGLGLEAHADTYVYSLQNHSSNASSSGGVNTNVTGSNQIIDPTTNPTCDLKTSLLSQNPLSSLDAQVLLADNTHFEVSTAVSNDMKSLLQPSNMINIQQPNIQQTNISIQQTCVPVQQTSITCNVPIKSSVNSVNAGKRKGLPKGGYNQNQKPGSKPSSKEPHLDDMSSSFQPLADYIVKCLNNFGICVIDNFMGEPKGSDVLNEILELERGGRLKDGQLVSRSSTTKKIRGDKISWVEKGQEGYPDIGMLIQRIDTLVMKCNGHLGKYNIHGRTKAMVACYPSHGTGYMRHVDNPNEDGRCITCIYYLNKKWDVNKDGGLLRIFPSMCSHVADVEPKFDRLLFFWADRRNPHEVQPSFRTRYAITVWYFDAEERTKARHRFHIEEETKDGSQKA